MQKMYLHVRVHLDSSYMFNTKSDHSFSPDFSIRPLIVILQFKKMKFNKIINNYIFFTFFM